MKMWLMRDRPHPESAISDPAVGCRISGLWLNHVQYSVVGDTLHFVSEPCRNFLGEMNFLQNILSLERWEKG